MLVDSDWKSVYINAWETFDALRARAIERTNPLVAPDLDMATATEEDLHAQDAREKALARAGRVWCGRPALLHSAMVVTCSRDTMRLVHPHPLRHDEDGCHWWDLPLLWVSKEFHVGRTEAKSELTARAFLFGDPDLLKEWLTAAEVCGRAILGVPSRDLERAGATSLGPLSDALEPATRWLLATTAMGFNCHGGAYHGCSRSLYVEGSDTPIEFNRKAISEIEIRKAVAAKRSEESFASVWGRLPGPRFSTPPLTENGDWHLLLEPALDVYDISSLCVRELVDHRRVGAISDPISWHDAADVAGVASVTIKRWVKNRHLPVYGPDEAISRSELVRLLPTVLKRRHRPKSKAPGRR